MELQGSYFYIKKREIINGEPLHERFEVGLEAAHPVYQGHFPGEPVCPGVCSMQMIKECAQLMAKEELVINYIKQYKLLSVITPQANGSITIEITLGCEEKEEKKFYKMKATATDSANPEIKFLELSAEMISNF